eukprot:TRINITY_DN11111_c0_g1_i2.p1 TRINITY_DN11111_c0_g1~~TRINITY_DN11111_c0_g1_i2.p1  ORF type:complete len:145 (+),score=12.57 TRINITY_DN11111_c0_g1_i2:49-483(+)
MCIRDRYTTAIPMPSFPSSSSLPKMGDYLTALQNLIDTIRQQSRSSSSSCGSGGGIDSSPVLMVSTFMAALGAVTELAERYDDEPSSDHYACMKDALSTQEHILLDAATVAKQQHQGVIGDEDRVGGTVVVPLLVLTQRLLWAM